MSGPYLLRKRADAPHSAGLYWRPNSQGYTSRLAEAGRYIREEAEARVSPTTEAIPVPDIHSLDDEEPRE